MLVFFLVPVALGFFERRIVGLIVVVVLGSLFGEVSGIFGEAVVDKDFVDLCFEAFFDFAGQLDLVEGEFVLAPEPHIAFEEGVVDLQFVYLVHVLVVLVVVVVVLDDEAGKGHFPEPNEVLYIFLVSFTHPAEKIGAFGTVGDQGEDESVVEEQDVFDIEVAVLEKFQDVADVFGVLDGVVGAEFGEEPEVLDKFRNRQFLLHEVLLGQVEALNVLGVEVDDGLLDVRFLLSHLPPQQLVVESVPQVLLAL